MSLDAGVTRLKTLGTVTIRPHADEHGIQIIVEGFAGENASCRDVAVLAEAWAIGVLQRSLVAGIQQPGAGASAIG